MTEYYGRISVTILYREQWAPIPLTLGAQAWAAVEDLSNRPGAIMRLRLASLLAVAVQPYPHMLQTLHTLAHSSTPFAAGEQGQSVYIGIEIPVGRTYRFCLDFHIDPDNAAQRSAMNQLPGDSAAGRIRLPVRLRIVQMREHDFVPLLDQAFAEERQVSVPSGYVSMVIASLELPAGDYRIRAEALQNNEATRALPIAFGVHPG